MDADKIIEAAAKFAKETAGQPQQQQTIQPQPVPMSIQMATSQAVDGSKFVVLVIQTPVGQHVFHFHPEGAEQIADGLKDTARIARTGLEIPRI